MWVGWAQGQAIFWWIPVLCFYLHSWWSEIPWTGCSCSEFKVKCSRAQSLKWLLQSLAPCEGNISGHWQCSPYLNLLKRLRSFGAEKLKPGHRNLGYFGTQPSCPIIKPIPKGSLFGQTIRFCVQNVTFWVCWTFAGWAAWCSSACVCQQTGSAQCNECSRDHWQARPPLVAPTPLVSLALRCASVSSSGLSTFSLSDLHDQGIVCQNPTSGLKRLRMGRW